MTVATPTRKRRGRPPKDAAPAPTNGNGYKPAPTLDSVKSASAILEAEGELHGRNLLDIEGAPVLVVDFMTTEQDIAGGTTYDSGGGVFTQEARNADKVILWLMPASEDSLAKLDPAHPRDEADVFHTFSSIIARQMTKIGKANLPVVATFVRRSTADGRKDPRTDRNFEAWTIEV